MFTNLLKLKMIAIIISAPCVIYIILNNTVTYADYLKKEVKVTKYKNIVSTVTEFYTACLILRHSQYKRLSLRKLYLLKLFCEIVDEYEM